MEVILREGELRPGVPIALLVGETTAALIERLATGETTVFTRDSVKLVLPNGGNGGNGAAAVRDERNMVEKLTGIKDLPLPVDYTTRVETPLYCPRVNCPRHTLPFTGRTARSKLGTHEWAMHGAGRKKLQVARKRKHK